MLHVDSGSAARPRRTRPLDALLSLRKSWALINSSSLFKRLALCMAIVGVVSEVGRQLCALVQGASFGAVFSRLSTGIRHWESYRSDEQSMPSIAKPAVSLFACHVSTLYLVHPFAQIQHHFTCPFVAACIAIFDVRAYKTC